jgi:MoxR-like ATPase
MQDQVNIFNDHIARLRTEIGRVLVGQSGVVDGVLTCLVADGHVLLEGVPGLGKTLLVRTLADCLSMTYRRIQFTPDLMPADIIGTEILVQDESGNRRLEFQRGPVFTQVLLADEINRATPKTQSALLEAMQEHQVTIRGTRQPLPAPFFVMATQNPLEMEGTYPLPEAQLDRFFFKVHVPFPTEQELVEVMHRTTGNDTATASAVLGTEELSQMRAIVRQVPVSPAVMRYAMRLIIGTQPQEEAATPSAKKYLRYGASPRGAQTLILGSRVHALFQGNAHVGVSDIRAITKNALRHRLGLTFDAEAEGLSAEDIVEMILDETPEVSNAISQEIHA